MRSYAGSVRERIGAHLHLVELRRVLDAAFVVERRPAAERGPDALALPAGLGIVDAAVDVLGEEAERIGNPKGHELAVYECGECLAAVGGSDRHVCPEPERV